MKTRFKNLRHQLAASFWFIPAVFLVGAVLLALLTTFLDRATSAGWQNGSFDPWWVFAGDADSARQVLSATSSSMITTAALVFSITMVVLSVTSQQFGPHLIRTFMSDRANQVVLGSFLSTFLYCLVVLAFDGSGEQRVVPRVSLTVALVLATLNLAMLIFYIHHVAATLKATSIAARVGHEFVSAVKRLYPAIPESNHPAGDFTDKMLDGRLETESRAHVEATEAGYVQAIDLDGLLALATESDFLIKIEVDPGTFVMPGDLLALVVPAAHVSQSVHNHLNRAFLLGREPTLEQDAGFVVQQLLEIAERALSPGINDPNMALACLNWMGVGLDLVVQRQPPTRHQRDQGGTIRVSAPVRDFVTLIDQGFSEIRYYARSAPTVLLRMLDIIHALRRRTSDPLAAEALERHAELVRQAGTQLPDPGFRDAVENAYLAVRSRL